MSLAKSKKLLEEIIGEESFTEFEHGIPVKVPSPDEKSYWMAKTQWGLKLQQLTGDKLSEGLIKAEDEGLYDAAASFVVSGRLGRVDWRCGHIQVDLPEEMPPRPPLSLSFIDYLGSEVLGGILFVISLPVQYYKWCFDSAKESYDAPWYMIYIVSGVVFTFIHWTLLTIIVETLHLIPPPIPETWLTNLNLLSFWLLGGFFIGGPIVAILTKYLGWRHHWETMLKEVKE